MDNQDKGSVVNELETLLIKHKALIEYLDSVDEEDPLLVTQSLVMQAYISILDNRVMTWEEK